MKSNRPSVRFSHYNHLDAVGKNCSSCHNEISMGRRQGGHEQMESGKSCGACHDGTTAFIMKENCNVGHRM